MTLAGSTIERLVAMLRGDSVTPVRDDRAGAELIEAGTAHGLLPLLARHLHTTDLNAWPPAVRKVAHREPALSAALELMRRQELLAVLDALAGRGIRPILLKGSALAYTHYEDPSLRPSFDVDLLVPRSDMDAVGEVMRARGYARPHQVTGELVMHQLDFARRDEHGVLHAFDFHWKLLNRQAVADMLSYGEMDREARPIPPLGEHARGLSPVHALLLACVHRVVHHSADERLIWLYDIHLLTEALTEDESSRFASHATSRAVSAVCLDGLEAASRVLGTRVPAALVDTLHEAATRDGAEPSAAFLRRCDNRIDELVSDLRALPAWSQRLRLVYEHAFPPPSYMTGTYMVSNRVWLPALYTHRIVRGAWRWLRRDSR